jgi:hypothetical protein
VTVTAFCVATGCVVAENVEESWPTGTVTLAGTETAASPLDSVTSAPPEGATLVKVTVPVEEVGPVTLDGEKASEEIVAAGAEIVRFAEAVTPQLFALITTVPPAYAGDAETVNVAKDCPAATVTVAGTVAPEVSELTSATTVPPDGAGPLMVRVAVEEPPAGTVEGTREREDGRPARTESVPAALTFPDSA